MTRRAALGATGSAALTALVGCRRCGEDAELPPAHVVPSASADPRPDAPFPAGEWRDAAWPPSDGLPEGEAALVRRGDGVDAPLVVALHGRGESGRGLLAGASGYRDDYAIEKVEAKLLAGSITADDLGGFATADRIAALNRSLAAATYRRPTLVTPYCPASRDRSVAGARAFAEFVCGPLLRRAGELLGGETPHARCGIDGISMGGRLALQVAIARPGVFATVGAMQPAVAVEEASDVADALADAYRRAAFTLRLASSKDDPFLEAVRALDDALAKRSVPHLFIVTPGPHDYAWNRGPGAAELLLFHERALRGLTPP